MPVPKTWIDKGFYATHARTLLMFEQLKGKHCTCGLDNLHISEKFCRATASEIPQKMMTHGACRMHDRGLPKCVIMKEQKTES